MSRFDESHQAGPPPVRLQVERPRFPQAGPFPFCPYRFLAGSDRA
jgi:hypothetical protein